MMGTLWTESSYPGPHALQPHLCRDPSLPKESSEHRSREREQGWDGARLGTRPPTSQPVPFCLGGDSSKPGSPSSLPQTLNHLAWVVRALLSSGLRVEGLGTLQRQSLGCRHPELSQCRWRRAGWEAEFLLPTRVPR